MPTPKSIPRRAIEARQRRRYDAVDIRSWNGADIAAEVRNEIAEVEDAGLLYPHLLDRYQDELVNLIEPNAGLVFSGLRDSIASTVATRAFGGGSYAKGVNLDLARGAAAVSELAIEEALWTVASAVSLDLYWKAPPLKPVRMERKAGRSLRSMLAAEIAPDGGWTGGPQ